MVLLRVDLDRKVVDGHRDADVTAVKRGAFRNVHTAVRSKWLALMWPLCAPCGFLCMPRPWCTGGIDNLYQSPVRQRTISINQVEDVAHTAQPQEAV